MSILTIGLFEYEDAFLIGRTGQDQYGPEIRKLRQKYPYHNGNRKPIHVTQQGRRVKQRSLMVRIPT